MQLPEGLLLFGRFAWVKQVVRTRGDRAGEAVPDFYEVGVLVGASERPVRATYFVADQEMGGERTRMGAVMEAGGFPPEGEPVGLRVVARGRVGVDGKGKDKAYVDYRAIGVVRIGGDAASSG